MDLVVAFANLLGLLYFVLKSVMSFSSFPSQCPFCERHSKLIRMACQQRIMNGTNFKGDRSHLEVKFAQGNLFFVMKISLFKICS